MSDEHRIIHWQRDRSTAATVYRSNDDRFEIIWGPDGWHLWDRHKLVGVLPVWL